MEKEKFWKKNLKNHNYIPELVTLPLGLSVNVAQKKKKKTLHVAEKQVGHFAEDDCLAWCVVSSTEIKIFFEKSFQKQ